MPYSKGSNQKCNKKTCYFIILALGFELLLLMLLELCR
jgi:hypothetical protein